VGRVKSKKVSVLIVPEGEGAVFSFKLPVLIFRVVVVAGAVGLILVLFMFISWSQLLRKASTYDRLAEENATLLQEHDRIVQLQDRVERLQQLEEQIRRVLGVKVSPDSIGRFIEPLYAAQSESPSREEEIAQTSSPAAPGAHPAIYSLMDAGILKEPEIPSLWPVQGFQTRGFEPDEIAPERGHVGVDFAAREGTVIKATAGGIVVWSGWSTLYGNVVILAHSSEYFSFYGHNQTNLVQPRQQIRRGDPIALLGNTGKSTAPHLHFEIWRGGEPLDPSNILMPN
jgi:murein DD-endopeptidase MepM/ murein hydrolase activator NlpD